MRTLAVVGCVGILALSVVVACSGDEVKKVHGDAAGAAGRGDGGVAAGGVHQGGDRAEPAAGSGGELVSGGAEAGGAGGVAEVGGPAGAQGGAPARECPAQVGKFSHACADAVSTWAPVWNNMLSRFELQLGALPFPLASGTVSFFYNNADNQQCGTVPIQVTANGIVAPVATVFPPVAVRITTFTFTDVCGNLHVYDAASAPACNDIRGSGTGFGSYVLACNTRTDANCPEACE